MLALARLEWVSARGNPLTSDSVFTHVAALRARGVVVLLDPVILATISDPGLRGAVERTLGKTPGAALTEGDLLTLRMLDANALAVRDLSGLGAAVNLERLSLDDNALAEIGELAALRRLSWLDLSGNALRGIDALAGLPALRTLLLSGNALEDVSALSTLTGLRELALSDTGLSELSALSDLASLEQLWLEGNGLSDLSPLSGLAALRYLHLGRNRVADLAPLSRLAELTRLSLPDNAVENAAPLAGLRSLSALDLERNRVADAAPLAGLPALRRLRLGWNRVADAAPLRSGAWLSSESVVGLRGNPLTQASFEDDIPALRAAGAKVVVGWLIPSFPSASAGHGRSREGFVRVVNRSEAAGEVLVEAVDDSGTRFGPVRLSLGPRQVAHFNAADLEIGNAGKGLPVGLGPPPAGGWRLELSSALDVEALSYLRTADGFLTANHDLLLRDGDSLDAALFNPASNRRQRGSLRLFNPGAVDEAVSVWGVDDAGRGRLATGAVVPAGGALTLTSMQLESLLGMYGGVDRGLGDGEGKWRLAVFAPWPVRAAALLESPSGHLANLSSPPLSAGADGVVRVPLLPPAAEDAERLGFLRVANRSARGGVVWVSAVDDAGHRAGPVALHLDAGRTAHVNSRDLENGNAGRGLPAGVGPPTGGSWRVALRSELDLRVGAYARAADGFLTSLHDAAPRALDSAGESGTARVAVFNPASNRNQRSLLRLANDADRDAVALVRGMDDGGAEAGPVRLTVPAGAALTVTSVDLEDAGLGDGEGKWRLTVEFDSPLTVMSLLESATGHLTNLSTVAR